MYGWECSGCGKFNGEYTNVCSCVDSFLADKRVIISRVGNCKDKVELLKLLKDLLKIVN